MTCKACSSSPIPGTVWRKLSLDDGWGSEVKCDECDGTGEVMETDAEIRLRVLRAAAGPLDFAAAEADAIDMGREALAIGREIVAAYDGYLARGMRTAPDEYQRMVEAIQMMRALLARARGDA